MQVEQPTVPEALQIEICGDHEKLCYTNHVKSDYTSA